MVKKCVWIFLCCLMTISLAVASCSTTDTTEKQEEDEQEEVKIEITEEKTEEQEQSDTVTGGKEMVKNAAGNMVEKPVYGGTLSLYQPASPLNWDEAFSARMMMWPTYYINDMLLIGDWSKGPLGTGEVTWLHQVTPKPDIMVGALAESWEIVDDTTLRFNIRHGVHFHDKPPVNGRELTADDVVYSLMRIATTDTAWTARTCGLGKFVESITAPDDWTVEIKSVNGELLKEVYYSYCIQGGSIIPHEVVDMYGNMEDWENSSGTGPFMLTDYIVDSSAIFKRNPNYYMKDPLLPENTLPYVNHLKVLIIADASTKQAAFRTGKIDTLFNIIREDKQFFEKTNPDVQWARFIPPQIDLTWRVDTAPFDNILVRKALWKAVDREEIANSYYGGDAVLQDFVAYPVPENSGYYTPLEELPAEARDIYIYDVEKAKELLAEAGYPNGFKTNIYTTSTSVDLLSIIKAYWEAVGVDMDLNVVDGGALNGMINTYTYDQIVASGGSPYRPESFTQFAAGQRVNRCLSDDPVVNQARIDASATFLTDRVRHEQIVRDTIIHIIEQAYVFCPPAPYGFIGWHPWLKSYNGEQTVGGRGQTGQEAYFVWIDQELKRSMGY